MLYYFFRYLEQFDVPGAHLMHYISFRSITALIFSLILSALCGKFFIRKMKKKKICEVQRDSKTDPFGVKKKGIPPMGGIVIFASFMIPVILLGRIRNIYLILMIVTAVWLGLLGFVDDYIKVFKNRKDGLRPSHKLAGQLILGLIVGVTLWASPDATIHESVVIEQNDGKNIVVHKSSPEKSNITTIPFVKSHNLAYSELCGFMGKYKHTAGWVLFVIVTTIIVALVSNGANINDGMDGMLAGNSAIMGVALGILAYVSSHIGFASYLNIMYIPGTQEMVVFFFAFIGAMIGFLWYNAYPAQMFMGDTGSLMIGGIISVGAIIMHKEILLFILCGTFIAEGLSSLIQTGFFKYMKRKGKRVRIFRAAPLHDNFRKEDKDLDETSHYILRNWPKRQFHESKITVRFWITTLILAAITIITLKIR